MINWFKLIDQNRAAEPIPVRSKILSDNLRRGRYLAILVICVETIFILFDLIAMAVGYHKNFSYLAYLILYVIMLAINIAFLYLATTRFQSLSTASSQPDRTSEYIILGYMTTVMCWGSIVTLLDQQLYGQTIVFMVNMIACAVIFIQDWRSMLIPFTSSSLIVLIGLPFFQTKGDILFGHYVNLIIFISMSWLASQFIFQAYHLNLKSSLEIEKTNQLLENEIEQNRQINEMLNQVNFQLRSLSLVDELTGVANRRGLRNFIDQAFIQKEIQVEHMGVLMIDLDRFKQYNDNFSHTAGDKALVAIGHILKEKAWLPLELVARWGGDEFVLVSYSRNADELIDLADSIRQRVEILSSEENSGLSGLMTVSIGTSFREANKPSDSGPIISDADMAMYSAKRAGRNKVWSYPARVRIIPVSTLDQVQVTASLAEKIWREYYPPIYDTEQIEYMLDKFQSANQIWQDIQANHFQYDLVTYQDDWAGYMAARTEEYAQAIFLSQLYIDKIYRRNHLARRLLDSLIERGKALGLHTIYVTVNRQNAQSISFYENCGFVKTGSRTTDLGAGYVTDDYVMTLNLPE
jgi:diguanylate cyclase (GGDEF)-like protein